MAITALGITTTLLIFFLLVVSICTAVSASQCYKSTLYVSNSDVQNAYMFFTISTVMGFIIIIVLAVTAFAYGKAKGTISEFKAYEEAEYILKKRYLQREPRAGGTFLGLIILAFFILVMGAMSAYATGQLHDIEGNDNINSAYYAGVVAAVTGIACVLLVFIAIAVYYYNDPRNIENPYKIEALEYRTNMEELENEYTKLLEKESKSYKELQDIQKLATDANPKTQEIYEKLEEIQKIERGLKEIRAKRRMAFKIGNKDMNYFAY